jgi:hypothetical protein
MRKVLFSIFAVALPVYAMAQCPSTEAVTATVTLQYSAPYMLEGEFSVSQYTKVNFSQGNLQYKASAAGTQADPKWRFAEHQWDALGGTGSNSVAPLNVASGNNTAEASRATQSDLIDLFGWATSGNPASNCECYQPYAVTTTKTNCVGTPNSSPGVQDAGAQYGPGIYPESGSKYHGVEWNREHCDWGFVNAVQLGLGWRVLTGDEWRYLFLTRTASTINGTGNARYTTAYLFGSIHGVILFPDVYTHPDDVPLPTNINSYSGWATANQYTAEQWDKMEAAGCVFLPAAGYRAGENVLYANAYCEYWSSTASQPAYAYVLLVNSGNIKAGVYSEVTGSAWSSSYTQTQGRQYGCAVRLVKEHQ